MRWVRPLVAVTVAGLVLAGCTDRPATPPEAATTDPALAADSTATSDPADSVERTEIQGGEGACTEALREGPLIDPDDSAIGEAPPGAEPLPVVNLPRIDTCELSSTAEWVGRPLVINFWASWCGPCVREMPMLDEFARDNADRIDLVGVTIDFRPVDATDFLDEVPVSFDSWFDPDGQVLARDVSVRGMPTTLFVDADGMVVHRNFGELSRTQLDAAVTEHLGVEPVG